jgi:hypothetical protein
MRRTRRVALFALLALLGCLSYFDAGNEVECGADAVTGTLTSMVRERVLRVADDAYPPAVDAARRAALTKATRVTPREAKLVAWDANTGRLACVARVVVDAPGPDLDTNRRSIAEVRYRVTRDAADVYLVEVAFADLMKAFPSRAGPGAMQ